MVGKNNEYLWIKILLNQTRAREYTEYYYKVHLLPVESVRFLSRGEPCILSDSPGLGGIHGSIWSSGKRKLRRSCSHNIEELLSTSDGHGNLKTQSDSAMALISFRMSSKYVCTVLNTFFISLIYTSFEGNFILHQDAA